MENPLIQPKIDGYLQLDYRLLPIRREPGGDWRKGDFKGAMEAVFKDQLMAARTGHDLQADYEARDHRRPSG